MLCITDVEIFKLFIYAFENLFPDNGIIPTVFILTTCENAAFTSKHNRRHRILIQHCVLIRVCKNPHQPIMRDLSDFFQ